MVDALIDSCENRNEEPVCAMACRGQQQTAVGPAIGRGWRSCIKRRFPDLFIRDGFEFGMMLDEPCCLLRVFLRQNRAGDINQPPTWLDNGYRRLPFFVGQIVGVFAKTFRRLLL